MFTSIVNINQLSEWPEFMVHSALVKPATYSIEGLIFILKVDYLSNSFQVLGALKPNLKDELPQLHKTHLYLRRHR